MSMQHPFMMVIKRSEPWWASPLEDDVIPHYYSPYLSLRKLCLLHFRQQCGLVPRSSRLLSTNVNTSINSHVSTSCVKATYWNAFWKAVSAKCPSCEWMEEIGLTMFCWSTKQYNKSKRTLYKQFLLMPVHPKWTKLLLIPKTKLVSIGECDPLQSYTGVCVEFVLNLKYII